MWFIAAKGLQSEKRVFRRESVSRTRRYEPPVVTTYQVANPALTEKAIPLIAGVVALLLWATPATERVDETLEGTSL